MDAIEVLNNLKKIRCILLDILPSDMNKEESDYILAMDKAIILVENRILLERLREARSSGIDE